MLVEKPTLNPMADMTIRQLTSDGVIVTHQDALWLHELAQAVSRPSGRMDAIDWIDCPLRCGNLYLYPLSNMAESWLFDVAAQWFDSDDQYALWAMVYAMERGREPGAFDALACERDARRQLRRWAATVLATNDELIQAKDALLQRWPVVELRVANEPKKERASVEWSGLLAWLCQRVRGTTPEYWMWRASAKTTAAIVSELVTQEQAKHVPDGGKARALVAYNAAVEDIRSRAI